MLQCVAVCCSVLQCVTNSQIHMNIHIYTITKILFHEETAHFMQHKQCVAVCCSVLQCVAVCHELTVSYGNSPIHAAQAVCCSVLQCVAAVCSVCCSALHHVAAVCCLLQCVAVCCSVLQCAAVCCCSVLPLFMYIGLFWCI